MKLKRRLRRLLSRPAQERVKRQLLAWGLEPVRNDPVDLRGLSVADPLDAWTRARGNPVLADLLPAHCRTTDPMGFAVTPDAPNPFVRTVRAILEGSATTYEGSPLREYYDGFRPEKVLDLYGWDAGGVAPDLLQPVLCAANPWEDTPGPHMRAMRRRVNAYEDAEYGRHAPDDDSYIDWGPATSGKGAMEFRRLGLLADSILRRGYEPQEGRDGHIRGFLLTDGRRSAVRIGNGHHRIAVLAALGAPTVPVLIFREVFRRDEADAWPGVVSGTFTREQALEAFDIVLHGRRPPWPGCIPQARRRVRASTRVSRL
jgi:hypothetical protein